MDEIWGRVHSKKMSCRLWHKTGDMAAYVMGTHEEEMLRELCLNIKVIKVYSDNNFAYHNVIPPNILKTGQD